MIAQRPAGAAPAIQAVAEALPLRSASFDAAIAVLTVHHWPDLRAGLAEMGRVARHQLVLTFDPDAHCRHWITDYIPEIGDLFRKAPWRRGRALIARAWATLTPAQPRRLVRQPRVGGALGRAGPLRWLRRRAGPDPRRLPCDS